MFLALRGWFLGGRHTSAKVRVVARRSCLEKAELGVPMAGEAHMGHVRLGFLCRGDLETEKLRP